jgi:hypothetical protein
MQAGVDLWEGIIDATGGALAVEKVAGGWLTSFGMTKAASSTRQSRIPQDSSPSRIGMG